MTSSPPDEEEEAPYVDNSGMDLSGIRNCAADGTPPDWFVKDDRYFSKGESDDEFYTQGTVGPFYDSEGNEISTALYWLKILDCANFHNKRDLYYDQDLAPGTTAAAAIEIDEDYIF